MILDSSNSSYRKQLLCSKFSETSDIEGLLWIEESYWKIAKKFNWENIGPPKLFDNFDMHGS